MVATNVIKDYLTDLHTFDGISVTDGYRVPETRHKGKKKIKQSHYRPGVAQMIPGS